MVKVAFIHPDLGIGGAEQLIVNLALLCKQNNWEATIYTPFFDPKRAFEPVKDGTIPVVVVGNWFPRRIFGRCQALCEYIRFFIASIYLILFGRGIDLVVVDQITISLPFLFLRYKTFFYCHYPDKLLCTERSSLIKKLYRFIIDLLEELCLAFAGMIVVNSHYTQNVFKQAFKITGRLRSTPLVLFPCTDLSAFDSCSGKKEDLVKIRGLERLAEEYKENKEVIENSKFIITLNRYERKKNLPLAADAYIEFINLISKNKKIEKEKKETKYYFIVAGGYDERLDENYQVYNELKNKKYPNQNEVFFLKSISNQERGILFKNADVVLYTPKNEHFGIVPCEAMYCGAAVIAHRSGGPIETVTKDTGFLLDNEDPQKWGETIYNYLSELKISKEKLKDYIVDNYSLKRMNTDFINLLKSNWPKASFSKDSLKAEKVEKKIK